MKKISFSKVHKKLLKVVSAIMGAVFMVSICALDSETWIPFICLCVSGAWLTWYAKINNWFYIEGGEENGMD